MNYLGTAEKLYFTHAKKISYLTNDEEKELGKRKDKGDKDAFNKLVESNLMLVASIAHKYKSNRKHLKLIDLIQDGNLGLIEAAKRFEQERGNRFSTYARWWIRSYITNAIREYDHTIRPPANIQEMRNKIIKYNIEFITKEGRTPTPKETHKYTKIDLKKIEMIMGDCSHITISLQTPVNGKNHNNRESIEYFIKNESEVNDGKIIDNIKLKETINKLLKTLSPEEEMVLRRSFGIYEDYKMQCEKENLAKISRDLNLTREREN